MAYYEPLHEKTFDKLAEHCDVKFLNGVKMIKFGRVYFIKNPLMAMSDKKLSSLMEEKLLKKNFEEDMEAIYGKPIADAIQSDREAVGLTRHMKEIDKDIVLRLKE